MSVGLVNLGDLEYQKFEVGVRFGADWADISRRIGGRKLGIGHWIVPPGKASVPYHAHLVNEELALVLGGELRIRLDGREHRLEAGDMVAMPPGPQSAHQFLNRSERPAHLLLASTMIDREVVDYLDSGRRMLHVGHVAAEPDRVSVRIRDDRVLSSGEQAYFDFEPVDEPLEPAPAEPPERNPRIVAIDQVPDEPYALGPFRADRKRLGRAAGARLLGASQYRLRSGDSMWPYHFQHVNEEFFFVREGYGMLRTPDGPRELRPGDLVLCAPGAGGAHGIRNTGDGSLEVFALSTMEEPEISEYPDSEKVYVMAGAAPGGDAAARTLDAVFRRGDAVDYLDGER